MTINFRATSDTATLPVEAVAAAARALFEVIYPSESWDEVSGLADDNKTPSLARQAVFMRAARFGSEAYGRRMAGIRHRNPMSRGERQRVAHTWTAPVVTPDPFGLRDAAKHAGAQIRRYDEALAQNVVTGGKGAVSAMIREYSRAMSRLMTAAGDDV